MNSDYVSLLYNVFFYGTIAILLILLIITIKYLILMHLLICSKKKSDNALKKNIGANRTAYRRQAKRKLALDKYHQDAVKKMTTTTTDGTINSTGGMPLVNCNIDALLIDTENNILVIREEERTEYTINELNDHIFNKSLRDYKAAVKCITDSQRENIKKIVANRYRKSSKYDKKDIGSADQATQRDAEGESKQDLKAKPEAKNRKKDHRSDTEDTTEIRTTGTT